MKKSTAVSGGEVGSHFTAFILLPFVKLFFNLCYTRSLYIIEIVCEVLLQGHIVNVGFSLKRNDNFPRSVL